MYRRIQIQSTYGTTQAILRNPRCGSNHGDVSIKTNHATGHKKFSARSRGGNEVSFVVESTARRKSSTRSFVSSAAITIMARTRMWDGGKQRILKPFGMQHPLLPWNRPANSCSNAVADATVQQLIAESL